MSEVAKNAEIEDVLSSIRRLVAGADGGRRPARTAEGPEPETDDDTGQAPDGSAGDARDPGSDAEDGPDFEAAPETEAAGDGGVATMGAEAFAEAGPVQHFDADGSIENASSAADAEDPFGNDDVATVAGRPTDGTDPTAWEDGSTDEGDSLTDAPSASIAPGDPTAITPHPGDWSDDPDLEDGSALLLEPSQRVTEGDDAPAETLSADEAAADPAPPVSETDPGLEAASTMPDAEASDSDDAEARAGSDTDDHGMMDPTQAGSDTEPRDKRRSPFLPSSLQPDLPASATSPEEDAEPPAASSRTRGFGFGIPPRADPVRHVPIDQLPPASENADAPPEPPARGSPIISQDFRRKPAPKSSGGIHPGSGPAGKPSGEDSTPISQIDGAADGRDDNDAAVATLPSPGSDTDEGSLSHGARNPEPALSDGTHAARDDEAGDGGNPPTDPSIDTDTDSMAAEAAGPVPTHHGPDHQSDIAPDADARPAPAGGAAGIAAPEKGDDDMADNLFASNDSTMDVAAIRALVSDCVRQELEGAAGQRASDRIRSLVRSEIAKALEEMNRPT